jgi:hypothetical protein
VHINSETNNYGQRKSGSIRYRFYLLEYDNDLSKNEVNAETFHKECNASKEEPRCPGITLKIGARGQLRQDHKHWEVSRKSKHDILVSYDERSKTFIIKR